MNKTVWKKQKLFCLHYLLHCFFSPHISETVKFDRFFLFFCFMLLLFFQAQRIQVLQESYFHKYKIWSFEVGSEISWIFSHMRQENGSTTRSSSIHEYSFHVSDELSLRKCLQLLYDQKYQTFTKRANFIANVTENFRKIKYLTFLIRHCGNT